MEIKKIKRNIDEVIYAFHVPEDLIERVSVEDYFWQYIIKSQGFDFTDQQKNDILKEVVQSFFQKSVFHFDTLEEFQHLIFPSPRFSIKPYLFAHEYPIAGISLLRPIDIDLTYCSKRHSILVIVNDYIGHFSAMFDTNHKVVYIKTNHTYEKMSYAYFVDDPIIHYESDEWMRLSIRDDLFGYRMFNREVISMKISNKIPSFSLQRICPSFQSSDFIQHCIYQLLGEMDYINDMLWKCSEDTSFEYYFLKRYLELYIFVHNYINFNISLHHTLWNE